MYCSHCGKEIEAGAKFCPSCGKSNESFPKHGPVSSGTRFVNYILDSVFVFIFAIIITTIGSLIFKEEVIVTIVYFFSFIGYGLLFEGVWQRTPAKWITRTKVVSVDGTKPGFWRILGRTFARYIPFEPFSFFAGPIGWHDSLSNTLVVPSSYTPEEVKQIDPKYVVRSKMSTPVIVLIGVVVGIAVIGLLASTVLLALNSARVKSRDAKRASDIRQIETSLVLYYEEFGRYPHALSEIAPRYIDAVPEAPTPNDGTCTAEQNRYNYRYVTDEDYQLSFCMGETTGGISSGVNYLTPDGINNNGVQPNNGDEETNLGYSELTQTDIEDIVASIKSEEELPQELDEVTTMIDITSGPRTIRYHYELHDVSPADITEELLRDNIQPSLCSNTHTVELLNYDVTMEYFYSIVGSSRTFLTSFEKEDCIHTKNY